MRAHLIIVVGALVGCAGDVAHGPSTGGVVTEQSPTTAGSTTVEMSTTGASAPEASTGDAPTTGTEEATTTEASTTEAEVFDYEGEHVVVITDSEIKLCGGTMAHMDGFVKRISERLGVAPPVGSDRIRFTWASSQEQVNEFCSGLYEVFGCARGNQVASLQAPHNHELAHIVSFGVGVPPSFFLEGLAVAYEGYDGRALPSYSYYNGSDVEILDLIKSSGAMIREHADGYEKAGRFAAYLIGRHGMEKYLQFYANLHKGADIEEIEQAFQDWLGSSLEESIAGFVKPWTDDHFEAQLSECDAPEIPWDGALLKMKTEVLCLFDNAIGPYDGGVVEVQHTIDIPVDGAYELRIVGDDQEATIIPDFDFGPFIGVSIIPCGVGASGYMETRVNGTPRLAGLHAGRHSLRLFGMRTLFYPFEFMLKRLPPEDVIKDPP